MKGEMFSHWAQRPLGGEIRSSRHECFMGHSHYGTMLRVSLQPHCKEPYAGWCVRWARITPEDLTRVLISLDLQMAFLYGIHNSTNLGTSH